MKREQVERLERVIPTNWCDPLLTGPDAVVNPDKDGRYTGQDIERLLLALRERHDEAVAPLLQLAKAVSEAPVVRVGGADGLSAFLCALGKKSLPSMQGQRVRLVPAGEGKG